MVGANGNVCDHGDWFWVEQQDADLWMRNKTPIELHERLKKYLRFGEAKFDGAGYCYSRKGKMETPFCFDIKLVDCHWNDRNFFCLIFKYVMIPKMNLPLASLPCFYVFRIL